MEEVPSVCLSKPKKKKSFSREELVSCDLEETAGNGILPKRKKSLSKEPGSDPEEAGNKNVPKKKRKFSSKEEALSSGPEEATGSKSISKKKKKLQKRSQEA